MTLYCPSCGYNLTGLPENRCPECGKPFDPRQVGAGQVKRSRGGELPDDVTAAALAAWLLVCPAVFWLACGIVAAFIPLREYLLLPMIGIAALAMMPIALNLGRRIDYTRAATQGRHREWLARRATAWPLILGLWVIQLIAALGPVLLVMLLLSREGPSS